MPSKNTWLARRLQSASTVVLTLVAAAAGFGTYFCMYAFRRPFSVGTYEGLSFAGTRVDLKTALVISQVLGYALSKYLGIRVCSEMPRHRRAATLVALIFIAESALGLFAVLPTNWKVVALFLNGLPLGMVWGLVVRYLEGRRTSDVLLSVLCCSYIVSSAMVKDVGKELWLHHGVGEFWMPAATGLCFLPLFLICVWLLEQLPEPSAADAALRTPRKPMDRLERRAFLRRFFGGLVLLFVVYFFLTAYRDFRDNFGMEIFQRLGYDGEPAIFTRSEWPVALGVLMAMAALNLIRDNRRGLIVALLAMSGGTCLLGVATLLFDGGHLSGLTWMVLVGLGAYLAYVPFNSVLFDRLIACTRFVGTAVFAIYVGDTIGYTGSVGIVLYKDLFQGEADRLAFFRGFSYFLAVVGTAGLLASCAYFWRRGRPTGAPMGTPAHQVASTGPSSSSRSS